MFKMINTTIIDLLIYSVVFIISLIYTGDED